MRCVLLLMSAAIGLLLPAVGRSAERITPDNINGLQLRDVPAVAVGPTGRNLAYAVGRRGGSGDLFFREADLHILDRVSGKEEKLALEGGVLDMRWSPRGDWLGLIGTDAERSRFFGLLQSASPATPKVAALAELGFPMQMAWSPDGTRVAVLYVRTRHFGYRPEPKEVLYSSVDRELTPDASGDVNGNVVTVVVLSVPELKVLSRSQRRFVAAGPGTLDWEPQGGLVFAGIAEEASQDDKNDLIYALYAMDPDTGAVAPAAGTQQAVLNTARLPSGGRLLCLRPPGLSPYEFISEAKVLKQGRLFPGDASLCRGTPERAGDHLFLRRRLASITLGLVQEDGTLRELVPAGKSLGAHSISPDGTFVAAAIGDANRPEDVYLIDVGSGAAERLTDLNADIFQEYAFGEIEQLRWPSADGRFMIDGFLLKPPGFDPDRRYPLIVNIHGGPGGSYANAFEDLRFNPGRHSEMEIYASAGYLVLMPNPRGGVAGSEAFENALKGRIYDSLDQDIQPGIDLLLSRGYVDPQRMAVFGASYGGLVGAWATATSRRFRAASLNDGVYDHYQQYGMSLTEWSDFYLQADPVREASRFMELSPVMHADRICAPTLLRAGGIKLSELTINPFLPQALRYYHQLRRAGVPTELVVHTNEGHAITSSKYNADFLRLNLLWLDFWMNGVESSRPGYAEFMESWRAMRERATRELSGRCSQFAANRIKLGPRIESDRARSP